MESEKKNLLHFDREVKSEIQIWFTLFEKWKVKQKCLEIEIEKWNSREFFKSKTINTFLSKMVSDDIGNTWYCIVVHSFAWLICIDTIVLIWSDCHATGVGQSKILEKQGLGAVDYDDDFEDLDEYDADEGWERRNMAEIDKWFLLLTIN